MSSGRARWSTGILTIVSILAIIALAMGMRRAPAIMSPRPAAADDREWKSYLASMDRAVEAGNISLASRTWRDAYGAALGSRRWEPMLATGQAALRLGRAAGTMAGFDEKARQCYVTALFRARQQQSVDGVLLVAEAFAQLGDLDVATKAVRMAERLAEPPGEISRAPERVAAVRDRLRVRASPHQRMRLDPFPVLSPDEMTDP